MTLLSAWQVKDVHGCSRGLVIPQVKLLFESWLCGTETECGSSQEMIRAAWFAECTKGDLPSNYGINNTQWLNLFSFIRELQKTFKHQWTAECSCSKFCIFKFSSKSLIKKKTLLFSIVNSKECCFQMTPFVKWQTELDQQKRALNCLNNDYSLHKTVHLASRVNVLTGAHPG